MAWSSVIMGEPFEAGFSGGEDSAWTRLGAERGEAGLTRDQVAGPEESPPCSLPDPTSPERVRLAKALGRREEETQEPAARALS